MVSGVAPLRKECRIYLDVSFAISCRISNIHVSSEFRKLSWYILALGLGFLVFDLDKEVLDLGGKVVKR